MMMMTIMNNDDDDDDESLALSCHLLPPVCGPARQLTPDWPPKIGDQHHPR